MKNIQLISANEWRQGHPTAIGTQPSDMYYAKLCTNLLKEIDRLLDLYKMPDDGQREFALQIGHYVEDVVSGTHVFDSFRRLHEKMYGRKLPFFEIEDEYFEDEVNLLDIKFLVWNHCQFLHGGEAIMNPDNPVVDLIAEELFPMVCEAYEEAPEVEALHDFIFDKANYTDFVESKKVLSWLLLGNTFTSPDDIFDQIEDEIEKLAELNGAMPHEEIFYAVLSQYLFVKPCNFLALRANEWLAEMLLAEGQEKEAKKMATCQHTGMKHFEIIAVDGDYMTLEECETGKEYRLITNSLDGTSGIAENPIMNCDLVTIDGEKWETNGISFFSKDRPEKQRYVTDGKPAFDHYMKKLDGRRIAYFKNMQEMQKQLIGNVPHTIDSGVSADLNNAKGIVIFVNSDGSLNISPYLATTIPDPANLYFRQVDNTLLLASICDESMASSEMVQYLQRQGWLDNLALNSLISPERGHQLLQDNLDFLMRYFRREEYKKLEG